MSNNITTSERRTIIEDFASEINKYKEPTGQMAKPIPFRTEREDNKGRPIFKIPIEFLRYRRNNGRIKSDVKSYENNNEPIDVANGEHQKILEDFLYKKDMPKTEELMNLIRAEGQLEAAVITTDGFLVNGNRRKMAIQKLYEEYHDGKYKSMLVVILPGHSDEGGAPSYTEIRKLENRYQLQQDGKSEYTDLEKALTYRDNVNEGYALEEQLRDNPQFAKQSKKEFNRTINKIESDFLHPLDCVDDYLDWLDREGLYNTIEGRWQGFVAYGQLREDLKKPKKRIEYNIDESELGHVQDIAFKMIRKINFEGGWQKGLRQTIRDIPKWLSNKESKNHLLRLQEVKSNLSTEETTDRSGKELSEPEKDKKWSEKYNQTLNQHVNSAFKEYSFKDKTEKPLDLLDAAFKKITHTGMHTNIEFEQLNTALELCSEIIEKTDKLKKEFWSTRDKLDSLKSKYSK